MVLRNPLLLVTTRPSGSDSAHRCAGSWDLALLWLGHEGKVRVITSAAEDTENDEVGNPPGESVSELHTPEVILRCQTYILMSKKKPSGSTIVTTESYAWTRYLSPCEIYQTSTRSTIYRTYIGLVFDPNVESHVSGLHMRYKNGSAGKRLFVP